MQPEKSSTATCSAPPRLAARLRQRIDHRYRTVDEELRLGGVTISFMRIRDPDDVLDLVVREEDLRERLLGTRLPEDQLHLPYWAELWDSGIGLATFLERESGGSSCRANENKGDTTLYIKGRVPFTSPFTSARPGLQPGDSSELANPAKSRSLSFLDLGCGMGLVGTVAAALGHRVMLVDLEPAALLFATLNTLPYAHLVRVRRLDWRRDRLDERFDCILGADLLYERAQWPFLEAFWREHLQPGGRVLLSEPGRQTGDAFPQWIRARGWRVEHFSQEVPTRPRPIRIFALACLTSGAAARRAWL